MYRKFLSLAALCALSSSALALNLVQGGGFENPVIASGSSYTLSVNPTGWTGTGDLVIQNYLSSPSSGDGNQWFDLNPNTGAGTGLSQVIALTGGQQYAFQFVYNGGHGGSTPTTAIGYSIGAGSTSLLSGSVSTADMSYVTTPWRTVSATFTPVSNINATLKFLPNGTHSGGYIDAVSVTAVPEPGTFLTLALGLGAIGLVRSRRAALRGA